MGLFKSKTIISVASSVYNLAGDEINRPNFNQSLVVTNILSGTKRSMGETVTAGYLNGPGIKFRSFFRWALNNYDLIGMPTGNMYSSNTINTHMIETYIPHEPGETVWVQKAKLVDSQYDIWAEQWIIKNSPEEMNKPWLADFDDATKIVTITFEDTTTVSFTAVDFIMGDKYIYAHYTLSKSNLSEPVIEGSIVSLAPSDLFPSVVGYDLLTDVDTVRTVTLNTVTTTVDVFSDARPNENSTVTVTTTPSVTRNVKVYEKKTPDIDDAVIDGKKIRRDVRTLVQNQEVLTYVETSTTDTEIEPGVTRTRTVIITENYLGNDREYRDDTQILYSKTWMPLDMWIYRIGSGIIELDNIVNQVADYGKFFPMIPVRLNNKFVDDIPDAEIANIKEIKTLLKKAYKKGTDGGKYKNLIAELSENEDLNDLDYIYVVYGVPLNVIDKSARRYIYEFFERLKNDQIAGESAKITFANDMAAYNAAYAIWVEWRDNPNMSYMTEPTLPKKPTLTENEIIVQNLGADGGLNINYDIRIKWNFINEVFENGLGKPGVRVNEIWLEMLEDTKLLDNTYIRNRSGFISNDTDGYSNMRIWWQYEPDKYKYMDVAGLEHRNFIYGGKSVNTSARKALIDGEESGFIIPLHYATYRDMRVVDATQMSTACVFLVINAYETRKRKWYETGIFKILFVIVVAVISVVLTGGAGIGLLGSHITVGSALGVSGLTGAIVGAVANALAAIVLSTIIGKLTAKLGILGAILGAVLQIVITGGMANFHAGNGFQFDFSQLMKADNIIKLTNAAGNGYADYIRSGIIDLQNELIQFQENANTELRRVLEAYTEQFGYGGGQIDPTMFVGDNSPVVAESRDTFITRTLMTGSDVAQMSHDLLNDYVELNMTLTNVFN